MSARLHIEVSDRPLEELDAELLAVTFFDSDRPLRGAAGRADWRLCGGLSRLLQAGRLGGAADEAVLIAVRRGFAAPRLLGLGLGPRRAFAAEDWQSLGGEVVRRAVGLRAASVALPLSDPDAGPLGVPERAGWLLRGAVAALGDGSAVLQVQLAVAGADTDAVREEVRRFAARGRSGPVALQFDEADRVELARRLPHGDEQAGLRGTQVVK